MNRKRTKRSGRYILTCELMSQNENRCMEHGQAADNRSQAKTGGCKKSGKSGGSSENNKNCSSEHEFDIWPSYRTSSNSQNSMISGTWNTEDATGHWNSNSRHSSHACVHKSLHALLSLLQVPIRVGHGLHATRSFCHAVCTVPLHIFIYYCVFQDQNEWQIGSSKINIAVEVGVSWGDQRGGYVWMEQIVSRWILSWLHRSSSEQGLKMGEANKSWEREVWWNSLEFFPSIQAALSSLSAVFPADFSSPFSATAWMT